MPELSIALIQEAIRGDRRAIQELVDLLLPMVHYRVGRALLRRNRRRIAAADVRRETEDVLQSVLLFLLEDGAHRLLSLVPPVPEDGAPLARGVALLAEREAMSILRIRRRDDAVADERSDEPEGYASAAEGAGNRREVLPRLLDRVEAQLGEPERELFDLLVLEQRSTEEICTLLDMTPDAVTAARGRFARLSRALVAEVVAGGAPAEDTPMTGRG